MSGVFSDLIAYLADPNSWTGQDGIIARLSEHIGLSVLAVVLAVILALPPAMVLAHRRKGSVLAVGLVNVGRAVPTFGVIALALPLCLALGLGLGFWPTLIAMVVLAMPPIFTNTYTAVRQVDPAVVEAAEGMGFTGRQVMTGTELPLGMPVIWTAIRIASVQVVATATLGAIVGWGGLGRYVVDGFAQGNDVLVLLGGLLVALLAVATDLGFSATERLVLPPGATHRDRGELATAIGHG
ncbi:MAG TPA: ABC transporter permease [Acidimicrobiia bacterium]|jgi:osmoprotectant transport system permease protein